MRWSRAARLGSLVLVVTLAASACGDDDAADTATSTAGDPSSPTVGSDGDDTGAVVVVPQIDPTTIEDVIPGEPVEPGVAAEMGPLVVVVDDIATADAGTVSARIEADNVSADLQLGPDVYTQCTDDGRAGLPLADSEFQSLAELAAGASQAGRVDLEVPDDCARVVIQVRVLPVEPGGDHIAEYEVPAPG